MAAQGKEEPMVMQAEDEPMAAQAMTEDEKPDEPAEGLQLAIPMAPRSWEEIWQEKRRQTLEKIWEEMMRLQELTATIEDAEERESGASAAVSRCRTDEEQEQAHALAMKPWHEQSAARADFDRCRTWLGETKLLSYCDVTEVKKPEARATVPWTRSVW